MKRRRLLTLLVLAPVPALAQGPDTTRAQPELS